MVVHFRRPVDAGSKSCPIPRPLMSAPRAAIPTARAFGWRCRKVTVNTMAGGREALHRSVAGDMERAPPSLPHEVIEELARRAREAERLARQKRGASQQRTIAPSRCACMRRPPTFTRYTFERSDNVAVAADHTKDRLTLAFDAPISSTLPMSWRRCRRDRGVDTESATRAAGYASLAGQGRRAQLPRRQDGFVVDMSARAPNLASNVAPAAPTDAAKSPAAGNHRARNGPARDGIPCAHAQRPR